MIQFLVGDIPPAGRIIASLPDKHADWLRKTCFRGKDLAFAGNTRWNSFGQMMQDDDVFERFAANCREVARDATENVDESFEIIHPKQCVGWESTAARDRFSQTQLEPRKRDQKWRGEWVRHAANLHASLTNVLTFACTFTHFVRERELTQWSVVIRTIYPGRDMGELEGDVTAREGRVFYDRTFPGEPLP